MIERLCGNTKNGHNNNHRNSRLLRDDQCLNYGLFSAQLGLFLDEQLTFNEYFWNKNNHSGSTNTIINYNNNDDNLPILINHNHFNPDQHQSTTPPISKQSHQRSYNNNTTIKKNTIVKLEFLYKQRVKYGEIMSTLPLGKNQFFSICLFLFNENNLKFFFYLQQAQHEKNVNVHVF